MNNTNRKFLASPNFNTAFSGLAQCCACIELWFSSCPNRPLYIVYDHGGNHYFVVPQQQYKGSQASQKYFGGHIIFDGCLRMLREMANGIQPDFFPSPGNLQEN